MLIPTTVRRQLCGPKPVILCVCLVMMSTAAFSGIFLTVALVRNGDIIDNLRGGLSDKNTPLFGIYRDRDSSSHKSQGLISKDCEHDGVEAADRHLMRQQIVHHLLPTVQPSKRVAANDETKDNNNLFVSSQNKEDDGENIYIDGEDEKSRYHLVATVASATGGTDRNDLVVDTTEDITSIEYFDKIIADHKERSRQPVQKIKDTILTTLRPGRSINSRIDAKADPSAVFGPRQLLKQHFQEQQRRPISGQ